MKNELSVVAQNDSVIISLQRASTALAEAKTIQHTKKIIDVSAAAEIYAKRQHLGEAAVAMATSIKVEALRKLGEMLKATPKATGGDAQRTRFQKSTESPETLAELGIDKKTSSVAQALANLSEAAFEEVREGNETVSKAIAKVKEAKAAPPPPPPAPVVEPEHEAPPEYTELDAAHDQITGLQDALAVANIGSADQEEQKQAATLIAELRAHIKTLEATLKTVKISRDTFQNQVAEMQRQINRQRREIDRALGTKTA